MNVKSWFTRKKKKKNNMSSAVNLPGVLSIKHFNIYCILKREECSFYRVMCYLFVCVEVLRPGQPNGVMSSAVSLPNHTFTGQA